MSSVAIDGEDIYWIEGRPQEGGRNALVRRRPDGRIEEVTPPDFNVRTRVHEYGGGAYVVSEGVVYASNFSDQRIYRLDTTGARSRRCQSLRPVSGSMPTPRSIAGIGG